MRFRHVIALVLITAALVAPSTASAGTRARSTEMKWTMFHLVNVARWNHGLKPLQLNARLSKSAFGHSRQDGEDAGPCSTPRTSTTPVRRYRPHRWGENVGMASSVRGLHRAFMASDEHRANILGAGYRKVGIGLVRSGGYVWGTLIFYG